jgi:hypothetical protein
MINMIHLHGPSSSSILHFQIKLIRVCSQLTLKGVNVVNGMGGVKYIFFSLLQIYLSQITFFILDETVLIPYVRY